MFELECSCVNALRQVACAAGERGRCASVTPRDNKDAIGRRPAPFSPFSLFNSFRLLHENKTLKADIASLQKAE